ncbi:Mitochondrial distribution and morphology protein 12, partial [Basidiobolus ranarum]
MSFEIFWEKLDGEIASSVQEKFNNFFSKVKRPSFLGPIEVSEFNFGSVPPVIEMVDIADPFPEFYWTDEEEEEEEYDCSLADRLSETDSFHDNSSIGGDTASHLSFSSSQRFSHPRYHPGDFSRNPETFSDDGYYGIHNISGQYSHRSGPSTRSSPILPTSIPRNHAP